MHELTEKITKEMEKTPFFDAPRVLDKIITEWLEEKARILKTRWYEENLKRGFIREILGLSEPEVQVNGNFPYKDANYKLEVKPQPQHDSAVPKGQEKVEWCCEDFPLIAECGEVKFIHKNGKGGAVGMPFHNLSHCPFCGTPITRPKKPGKLGLLTSRKIWL